MRLPIIAPVCLLSLGFAACTSSGREDVSRDARVTLSEAIVRARTQTGGGTVVQAELEREKGRLICSMDVAHGTEIREIGLDAVTGDVVEDAIEHEDQSKLAAASKIPLDRAVEAALAGTQGRAILARLVFVESKPVAMVTTVGAKGFELVVVDGVSGSVLRRAAAGEEDEEEGEEAEENEQEEGEHAGAATSSAVQYVETFGEDPKDLASTGTNPWFVLEPGYVMELRGKEHGKDVVVTITVLDDTKKIDGVVTRAVEEREVVGGEIEEVTRDYFAISKRTNNVYYFGEDVDEYEDGKVKSHGGAWLAGEKGARYGLIMPGVPTVGQAYCQELAPGVGMDRARVVSLDGSFECPAGKFTHVLETEETNPLEKGAREKKLYARGVGILRDGDLVLVRYGKQ
ncbi:MAG: hypothetical protein HZA53_18660 [Planctomycetes bacterium]|nr:hypothetical protein [Planctomycetota bacterium]